MHSRWVDFLTTDGEKSYRDRDSEFVDDIGINQRNCLWKYGQMDGNYFLIP